MKEIRKEDLKEGMKVILAQEPGGGIYWNYAMQKFAGKQVTINYASKGTDEEDFFDIKEDKKRFNFSTKDIKSIVKEDKMKDKLKIKIWNYKNVVLYEVLEQDEDLRYEAKIFKANNGWEIRSGSYPEINTDEKIIYVRGDEKEFDEIVCTVDIDSVNARKLEYVEYLVKEVNQAVKEFNESFNQILDKEEKEYLKAVIRPFRSEVEWIAKRNEGFIEDGWCTYHIFIAMKKSRNCIPLPYFKGNTMYKGMKLSKAYTLEELGL